MGMEDHATNMRRSAYNSRDTTPAHRFTSPSQNPQQSQTQMHYYAPPQTFAAPHDATKQGQTHQFEDHALYRLLGTDMSNYFVANLDKYEAARKRWTDCTMKEWQAGAQGERQRMTGWLSTLIPTISSRNEGGIRQDRRFSE